MSDKGKQNSAEKTAKQIKHIHKVREQDDYLDSEDEAINFEFPEDYSEYDEQHDCIVSKFTKQKVADSVFFPDPFKSDAQSKTPGNLRNLLVSKFQPAQIERYDDRQSFTKKGVSKPLGYKSANQIVYEFTEKRMRKVNPERYMNLEKIEEKLPDTEDDKEGKVDQIMKKVSRLLCK